MIETPASCCISVIMATCGRPQFIEQAIRSVTIQTTPDWELLIVHDGGDDRTQEIVQAWHARDPRIRYFDRKARGNIANASNFALQASHGRYIAILDDDDFWIAPDKLERQVAYLDQHPACAGCGGGLVVVDTAGNELMRYLKPLDMATMRRAFLISNPIANSTVLFRREAACAVGGYDEDLSKYSDWDFFLKLGTKGELHNFPDYLSAYRMWTRSASIVDQRANAESTLAIIWRHRNSYPRNALALALGLAYWGYTLLPTVVRQRIFLPLSRIKKRIFSATWHG
jgi:glycosyltransferase involved in cell wall biosynthesis